MNNIRFILTLLGGVLFLLTSCEGLPKENDNLEEGKNNPVQSVLSFDDKSVSISDEGGTLRIPLNANCQFETNVLSGADWLAFSHTETLSDNLRNLLFEVERNDSPDNRGATVEVREQDGNLSARIEVIQRQKNSLTVTQPSFEIEETGGIVEIVVKTNIDFTATVEAKAADWLNIVSTKAISDQVVKVDVSANEKAESRSGAIIIEGAGLQERVVIYQQGLVPSLVLGETRFDVSSQGGSITVPVTYNVDFEVIMPQVDWVREDSGETKAMLSTERIFVIEENVDFDVRSCEIVFQALDGSVSQTVTITQSQLDAIIAGSGEYSVAKEGGIVSVTILSNIEYSVQIEDSASSWISIVPETKGLESSTLLLEVAQNTEPGSRVGAVVISGEGKKAVVSIIQAGDNVLVIGCTEFFIPATGGDFKVEVSSNMDFEVLLPDIDWITSINETKAVVTTWPSFHVQINSSFEERKAEIIFRNSEYDVSETVMVVQAGAPKDITLHVEKSGTLADLMSKEELALVSKLTLTGTVNQADLEMFQGIWQSAYGDPTTGNPLDPTTWDHSMGTLWMLEELDMSNLEVEEKKINTFWGFPYLRKVILPLNVEEIGGFYDCATLEDIVFPESSSVKMLTSHMEISGVPSIETEYSFIGAFSNCPALKKVVLPAGIESIEGLVFAHSGLEEIVFPSPCKMTSFKGKVFEYDSQWMIGYHHYAYFGMFSGCDNLKHIDIPQEVISFDDYAFKGWTGVENIEIPSHIENIGDNAFQGCTSLKTINVPSSVKYLGKNVFSGCTALEKVELASSFKKLEWTFSGCSSLVSIKADGVETIEGAFMNCTSLANVSLPALNQVGISSFQGCSSLEEIDIHNVEDLGSSAFSASGLKRFEFPEKIMNTPVDLLKNCLQLEEVDFGNLKSISFGCFEGCASLKSITLPVHLEFVSSSGFRNTGLEEVIIRSTSLAIDSSAFVDLPSLRRVVIGREVKSLRSSGSGSVFDASFSNFVFEEDGCLEDFALYKGLDITSIYLPETVKRVSDYAFSGCKKLSQEEIERFLQGRPVIGKHAFEYTTIRHIRIPDGVNTVEESAFYHCDDLLDVELPSTLNEIGKMAFAGDEKITSVKIEGTSLKIGARVFGDVYGSERILDEVTYSKTLKSLTGTIAARKVIFEEGFNADTMSGNFANYANEVVLASTMELIGDGMFKGWPGTQPIVLPASVKKIGKEAFYNCASVPSWEIPSTVEIIGDYAFYGCTNLQAIKLDAVRIIGKYAFYKSGLSGDLHLPSTLTFVGEDAFKNVQGGMLVLDAVPYMASSGISYNTIVVSEGVTSIPARAFKGLGMTTVSLPSTLSFIGERAFSSCSSLAGKLVLPASLTSVGDRAFESCSGITEWELTPAGFTEVGTCAFQGCQGVLTIKSDIPDSSSARNPLFNGAGFTKVIVEDGVKRIGQHAFSTLPLTDLTLPSTLESIADYAVKVTATSNPVLRIDLKAEIPPQCSVKWISLPANEEFTLSITVPSTSLTTYKNDEIWGTFANYLQGD